MSFAKLVAERRLVVCVGPGGVGKTTVAAAIGLLAARAGRRAFVLTIDPARRLADALGLHGLDDATSRVPLERLGHAGPGELFAAMVDTGASFDALVARIAPDAETRDRILGNRVYGTISRSLARSHAYVAMERLYHALEDEGHDLVVLDTPPARNAIEILDAPQSLARLLDARVIEWLMPAATATPGLASRMRARGGDMALSLLRRITGAELLHAIVEFFELFADLRQGFADRARAVDAILRQPSTAYALVSSGSPSAIDDAAWLRDDLLRLKIEVDAVLLNGSYEVVDRLDPRRIVTTVPAFDRDAVPPALRDRAELLERLRALRSRAAEKNLQTEPFVAGMRAELPSKTLVVRTPRFAEEVRDLPALARLADALADASGRQ